MSKSYKVKVMVEFLANIDDPVHFPVAVHHVGQFLGRPKPDQISVQIVSAALITKITEFKPKRNHNANPFR